MILERYYLGCLAHASYLVADEESRILERIARGEQVEHFETVRRRKGGELIDVSLAISPIRDRSRST